MNRLLIAILALLVGACVCGCIAASPSTQQTGGGDNATLVTENNGLKAEVTALRAKLEINTGGGDVNEPVTGWILAGGFVLLSLSYPVGKLVWLFTGRASRVADRAADAIARRIRNGPKSEGSEQPRSS